MQRYIHAGGDSDTSSFHCETPIESKLVAITLKTCQGHCVERRLLVQIIDVTTLNQEETMLGKSHSNTNWKPAKSEVATLSISPHKLAYTVTTDSSFGPKLQTVDVWH